MDAESGGLISASAGAQSSAGMVGRVHRGDGPVT